MTCRRQFVSLTVGSLGSALVAAAPAQAHGLVGKQDLPIPRWLFAWAAAVVLVISFVGLATLWPKPRLETASEHQVSRLPAFLDPLCGALGVALFAGLVYAGFAGVQVSNVNILPTVVYVVFWVGVPFVTVLFGDVFRPFNPWRAIGRGVGWTANRLAPGRLPEPLAYPKRLGRWPAVVGIFAFAMLELVLANRDQPQTLAVLALAYTAVQLLGAALFGVDAWSDRGDAFGVYFNVFSSLSPLRLSRTAVWRRAPLSGTATIAPSAGLVALVCVMIGSTSFDGLSTGSIWNNTASSLQPWFIRRGLNAEHASELTFLLGLIFMIAVVTSLYFLGCKGIRSALPAARAQSTSVLARRFAPSLVPISLAYVVAHYFGLLSYQGQAMAYLLSDPLGNGSDLFGTAHRTIDYNWISATGIWYVQVLALVTGHAAGLALAHDRALVLFPDPKVAARSQYWMLAVMVAFTSLALWLLSGSA